MIFATLTHSHGHGTTSPYALPLEIGMLVAIFLLIYLPLRLVEWLEKYSKRRRRRKMNQKREEVG
jgi:hypothetical protein